MRRLFLACALLVPALGAAAEPKPSYPLLEKVFRADLSREQSQALGENAPLEKVSSVLTARQRQAARGKLQEAEAGAATPEALEEIARGYLMLDENSPERGRSAVRVAARLQELDPRSSKGFALSASAHRQLGDYASAERLAREALERDPQDQTARAVLLLTAGRTSGQERPPAQAANSWNEPKSFFSGNPEAASLIQQSVAARKSGDHEKSWTLAQAAVLSDPSSPGVREFFRFVQADRRRRARAAAEPTAGPQDQPVQPVPATPPEGLPLWPLGALAGVGLAGYGVWRGRRTWAEQEFEAPPEEDPNSPRLRKNRRIARATVGVALVVLAVAATKRFGPGTAKTLQTLLAEPAATAPAAQLAGAGGGAVVVEQAVVAGGVKAAGATAVVVAGKTAHDQYSYTRPVNDGMPNQQSTILGQGSSSSLRKPAAKDPELQATIDRLFQPSDNLPGGTAGAVRQELSTGLPTKGRWHLQKARETINTLNRILRRRDLDPVDRATAEALKTDLQNAINLSSPRSIP